MFKRYSLIKTLTKNFNILSNADANADADADAGVTAIALPVLSYRRAKKHPRPASVGVQNLDLSSNNDVILILTHLSLASLLWDIGKQHSPRCDTTELQSIADRREK